MKVNYPEEVWDEAFAAWLEHQKLRLAIDSEDIRTYRVTVFEDRIEHTSGGDERIADHGGLPTDAMASTGGSIIGESWTDELSWDDEKQVFIDGEGDECSYEEALEGVIEGMRESDDAQVGVVADAIMRRQKWAEWRKARNWD